MQLSDEDQRFLARRLRLVQAWRYAGSFLLAMLTGLAVWLYVSRPFLANPFFVMTQLKNAAIPESTMVLMAAMLPVVVLLCITLAAAIILFTYAALSNEKKYFTIIDGFIKKPKKAYF